MFTILNRGMNGLAYRKIENLPCELGLCVTTLLVYFAKKKKILFVKFNLVMTTKI